jgi:hypothetical protein
MSAQEKALLDASRGRPAIGENEGMLKKINSWNNYLATTTSKLTVFVCSRRRHRIGQAARP